MTEIMGQEYTFDQLFAIVFSILAVCALIAIIGFTLFVNSRRSSNKIKNMDEKVKKSGPIADMKPSERNKITDHSESVRSREKQRIREKKKDKKLRDELENEDDFGENQIESLYVYEDDEDKKDPDKGEFNSNEQDRTTSRNDGYKSDMERKSNFPGSISNSDRESTDRKYEEREKSGKQESYSSQRFQDLPTTPAFSKPDREPDTPSFSSTSDSGGSTSSYSSSSDSSSSDSGSSSFD